MTTQKPFREVDVPEQQTQDDGVRFPAVLSPNTSTEYATATELTAFEDAIIANKPWLESLLLKSGAILFRGFPVISPSDFNNVVKAFGFPELSYSGGIATRTQVVDRVYTANEGPLDKEIPFHHEMAYLPNHPSKLFFFCEEEPRIGGETPIVLSHTIYEKMKEKYPDFVAKMEEHGLMYIKIATDDDNSSSYTGSSWKTAYKTDDKSIAEERAAKQGTKLEWMENGVKLTIGPLPAIRVDKESGRKMWFNSLAIDETSKPNVSVELGNGDPVCVDAVKGLFKVMKEECVAIPWKKGDVLLINNLTVLHGRRPLIKPPRRILASLCK